MHGQHDLVCVFEHIENVQLAMKIVFGRYSVEQVVQIQKLSICMNSLAYLKSKLCSMVAALSPAFCLRYVSLAAHIVKLYTNSEQWLGTRQAAE